MGTEGTEEEPSAGATDKFSLEVPFSGTAVCVFPFSELSSTSKFSSGVAAVSGAVSVLLFFFLKNPYSVLPSILLAEIAYS